jgi:hypothetical protein
LFNVKQFYKGDKTTMQNSDKLLLIQIEQKRIEMILLGKKYGLTSSETLHASQQLDRLLNKLYVN